MEDQLRRKEWVGLRGLCGCGSGSRTSVGRISDASHWGALMRSYLLDPLFHAESSHSMARPPMFVQTQVGRHDWLGRLCAAYPKAAPFAL